MIMSVLSHPYDEMDRVAGAGWSHLGDQLMDLANIAEIYGAHVFTNSR